MELNDKVTQLEDEIKILKNEIQAVLLDLRESYLTNKNPFNVSAAPMVSQPVSASQSSPTPVIPTATEPVKEASLPQSNVRTMIEPTETVNESVPDLEMPDIEECLSVNPLDDSEMSSELDREHEDENIIPAPPKRVAGNSISAPVKEWRSKPGISGICSPSPNTEGQRANIEISVITKLAQWIEGSVKLLGTRRTQTMLDVAEMMGYLKLDLKDILIKLVVQEAGLDINKTDAKDYLASWVELATILGKDNKPEIALFYMLCQEAENR